MIQGELAARDPPGHGAYIVETHWSRRTTTLGEAPGVSRISVMAELIEARIAPGRAPHVHARGTGPIARRRGRGGGLRPGRGIGARRHRRVGGSRAAARGAEQATRTRNESRPFRHDSRCGPDYDGADEEPKGPHHAHDPLPQHAYAVLLAACASAPPTKGDIGLATGALLAGVLGHEIGGGAGQTVATIGGAALALSWAAASGGAWIAATRRDDARAGPVGRWRVDDVAQRGHGHALLDHADAHVRGESAADAANSEPWCRSTAATNAHGTRAGAGRHVETLRWRASSAAR